jgi:hypothetical protein
MEYTIEYTLHNSTGFYAELLQDYGILEDWVIFGTETAKGCWDGTVCPTIKRVKEGYPMAAPDSDIIVPNPKKVITDSQPKITNITNVLFSTEIDINLGSWLGPLDDILQVVSMPIFLIMQAVDSMLQAKEIGENMREQEKRNFILMILSIVFSFIPFLGEIGGIVAGGAVGLSRIATLIGIVGDVGLGIEDIVHDKSSAPMVILGLLGGGFTRSEVNIGKLAATRRAKFPTSEMSKLGSVFKSRDAQLQSIISACKKA